MNLAWAIIVALVLAAAAWGKTQSDVTTLKREMAEQRKDGRRHDRLLTAVAAKLGLAATFSDEE